MAGGTPILIPAIGVCDGIAMGHVGMKYSLASREPVSYTHLDVYKRQVYNYRNEVGGFPANVLGGLAGVKEVEPFA